MSYTWPCKKGLRKPFGASGDSISPLFPSLSMETQPSMHGYFHIPSGSHPQCNSRANPPTAYILRGSTHTTYPGVHICYLVILTGWHKACLARVSFFMGGFFVMNKIAGFRARMLAQANAPAPTAPAPAPQRNQQHKQHKRKQQSNNRSYPSLALAPDTPSKPDPDSFIKGIMSTMSQDCKDVLGMLLVSRSLGIESTDLNSTLSFVRNLRTQPPRSMDQIIGSAIEKHVEASAQYKGLGIAMKLIGTGG